MVTSAIPIATMPPLEETPVLYTLPTRQQQTATPIPFTEQLTAHQEERRHALQDDIEREIARQQSELAYEQVAAEVRLTDLHQCEAITHMIMSA
jgi:hypothetical protein